MVDVTQIDSPAPEGGGWGDRAQRLIERAGVAPEEVLELPFDLSMLTEEGIVVDVDAHGTGIFDTRLDLGEVGVSWPEGVESPLKPVGCLLVPTKHRNSLVRPASQGHDVLRRYSYSFLVLEVLTNSASNRWVPWRAWPEFKEAFLGCVAALDAAKARYREEHAEIVETMAETFRLLAVDTAERLQATARGRGVQVSSDFAELFVEKMLGRIPTPDDVEARLTVGYKVRPLRLGSEMLAEQARATEARTRLRLVEEEQRLATQRLENERRALQAALWADEESARARLRAEEEERRREAGIKEEFRQLRLHAAREQLQDTMSPFVEGAQQLHAALYEAASAIREALAEGHLEAKKARELARLYSLMNFQSEPELDALVSEMEQLTRQAEREGKRKRQDAPIDRVLGDIVRHTYAGARALTERSRADAIQL